MRTKAGIDYPLDKTLLNLGLVCVVRLSVGIKKPLRQMGLGTNDRSPRIHHLFRMGLEYLAMTLQDLSIFLAPSDTLFQLSQFFEGQR